MVCVMEGLCACNLCVCVCCISVVCFGSWGWFECVCEVWVGGVCSVVCEECVFLRCVYVCVWGVCVGVCMCVVVVCVVCVGVCRGCF